MKRAFSFLAAAAVAWGGFVLPTFAAEPLTLREAEGKALAANPAVRAAKLEALAASARTQEAFGRHFGELSLVGSYNHFERDRLLVPMAIELFANPSLGMGQLPWDRNQVHYGVTWQLPILAAGTLHEGDRIARLSEKASEHLALFTQEQVLYNLRALYRNALLAQHALEAAHAYREALAKDEADAQLKVSIGALAPVDAEKITYALRAADAQVAQATADRKAAHAFLAALMGEDPPAEGYELEELPDEPAIPPESRETSLAAALSQRGDLQAVRKAAEIAERKKRLARDAFAPQLYLQATYLRNTAPSLQDPIDTREWTLVLRLPLFDGGTRWHALHEAEANLQANQEKERAKALEVAAQVVQAHAQLQAARALLDAGKAQRRLGQEVARVEHLKLEQGTGKIEDYLLAKAQELAGETAYWRGLYGLQSAVDYLAFVTGQGGSHD